MLAHLKSSRNRTKGDPQSPKGEALQHSANTDPERSVDTSNGNGSTPGGQAWLEAELALRGVTNPRVRFSGKHVWECRDGNRKLGVLSQAVIDEQNGQAVDALFDLRASVTIELETRQSDDAWGLLWATADALSYGQRCIVLAMMRADKGQKVDGYHVLGQMTRPPVSGALDDWTSRQKDPKRQALRWAGALRASAAKAASDKAKTWLAKEQAEKSPPWFKTKSFTVPKVALDLKMEGRDLFATMTLLEGGGSITLPAHATGASAWAIVRKIIQNTDGSRYLAGRCVYSEDRKRWLLKVSYRFPRPTRKSGAGVLAVLPSFSATLELYGSDGWCKGHRSIRADGAKVEDRLFVAKRRISQRRSALSAARALPGSGSRGHGKKRFLRSVERLRSAEDNVVTTYCYQAAADVVRVAEERGYGELLVADYDGDLPEHASTEVQKLLRKFPRAKLRDAVKWRADKIGIPSRVVPLTSKHCCPECGSTAGAMQPVSVWFCHGCGLRLGVGDWQAWRVLRAACGDAVDEVFRRKASLLEKTKAPP